jgi:hypothetical protein
MRGNVGRAVIEIGFIVFLFDANLLMGEFERSEMGLKRGIVWARRDVLTAANSPDCEKMRPLLDIYSLSFCARNADRGGNSDGTG